jgi:hypothetical protein
MGLDTECDLVIEASGAAERRAVADVRARLLSEHLGVEQRMLDEALGQQGSLIRAIKALNRGARGLRPYPEIKLDGPVRSRIGTFLADPTRPFEPWWWRKRRRFRRRGVRRASVRRAAGQAR